MTQSPKKEIINHSTRGGYYFSIRKEFNVFSDPDFSSEEISYDSVTDKAFLEDTIKNYNIIGVIATSEELEKINNYIRDWFINHSFFYSYKRDELNGFIFFTVNKNSIKAKTIGVVPEDKSRVEGFINRVSSIIPEHNDFNEFFIDYEEFFGDSEDSSLPENYAVILLFKDTNISINGKDDLPAFLKIRKYSIIGICTEDSDFYCDASVYNKKMIYTMPIKL